MQQCYGGNFFIYIMCIDIADNTPSIHTQYSIERYSYHIAAIQHTAYTLYNRHGFKI